MSFHLLPLSHWSLAWKTWKTAPESLYKSVYWVLLMIEPAAILYPQLLQFSICPESLLLVLERLGLPLSSSECTYTIQKQSKFPPWLSTQAVFEWWNKAIVHIALAQVEGTYAPYGPLHFCTMQNQTVSFETTNDITWPMWSVDYLFLAMNTDSPMLIYSKNLEYGVHCPSVTYLTEHCY